jgi:transcription elongation factor SPT6
MDRYVDPLVSHLKAMLSYRKFKKGSKAEVDELLRIEKSEFPMRIVYCFGISHEHPGTFILTFIRSTNPHHEYIGLYPKGFKFRKRMFEDIDRLVAYFQRHIDDPQSAQSLRSVAARVPMRSPATGGSSGASAGSGWGGSTNEDNWRGQSYDRDRSSTPGSRTGELFRSINCVFVTFIFYASTLALMCLFFLCMFSHSSFLFFVICFGQFTMLVYADLLYMFVYFGISF